MLSSRDEIRSASLTLAGRLREGYQDIKGEAWTDHIFNELRAFCMTELSVKVEDCFHRRHPTTQNEFLWDFIAVNQDSGILLAAESEQEAHNTATITGLKHDFEKLLYVYAPLRVLVCKARNSDEAKHLVAELTAYALGCCKAFNPGAVFLIHVCPWHNQPPLNYIWQSDGDPQQRRSEAMNFMPVQL